MANNEKLYISQEDLYRVGNSTSPQMSKLRSGEITIRELNGIKMIVADGKGVSLYNKDGLEKSELSGWVWEIKVDTQLPTGLYLKKDTDPNKKGHYFVCPRRNMPVHTYAGKLEEIAVHCQKVFKKKKA